MINYWSLDDALLVNWWLLDYNYSKFLLGFIIITTISPPTFQPPSNFPWRTVGSVGQSRTQLFRKTVQDDHGPLLRDLPKDTQRGSLDAGLSHHQGAKDRPELERWKIGVKATEEAIR